MFKQELASRLGVTVYTVSRWEKGKTAPLAPSVAALATLLNFPAAYFYGDAPPRLETAAFRSLSRMTARQRYMALAAGSQAVALDALISERFDRPKLRIPDLHELAKDPEAAADSLRAAWSLGYQPIGNLVHRMELNGVRVFSLVYNGNEIDAFSDWQNDIPYVFLNMSKTAERIRMDAAHELAHLTLHAHTGGPTTRIEEDQARQFAAAFLLPASAVIASAPQRITLESVIEAKQPWGVSALAYVRRLYSAGRLAEYSYRSLCIQIKSNFDAGEPGPERHKETSQVMAKVLGASKGGNVRKELARALNVHLADIDEITFGLALTPVSGNPSAKENAEAKAATLHLVS